MSQEPENPKIIMRQLKLVTQSPDPNFRLFQPSSHNMLEVHFTVRGPLNSIYEGGLYHGKILLPKEYPFKAPDVIMITPSGRFEVGKKLCFSFTSYHPETWSPAVGFGPIVIALQSLFEAYQENGIGMIKVVNKTEVERFRIESHKYCCSQCNIHHASLTLQ